MEPGLLDSEKGRGSSENEWMGCNAVSFIWKEILSTCLGLFLDIKIGFCPLELQGSFFHCVCYSQLRNWSMAFPSSTLQMYSFHHLLSELGFRPFLPSVLPFLFCFTFVFLYTWPLSLLHIFCYLESTVFSWYLQI